MNEWISAGRRWQRIGRRSWILAATVAVSLSASTCGKNYGPVEVPENAQAPGDNGNDGVADTGNAGAGAGGNDAAAGNDAAGTGITGGEGMTEAAGNAAADGDVSVKSSALETTIMTKIAPSFTGVSETVCVTGDQVDPRADASTPAEIVTTLSRETFLKWTAVSDTWSRMVYQEKTCYISTQYVSTMQPETESAKAASTVNGGEVRLNSSWRYAGLFKINPGAAILYKSEAAPQKGITVCVSAGHGTKDGSSMKAQCHPDGTPKVTDGTINAGTTSAAAVSGGVQFFDGTAGAKVTFAVAKKSKNKLLAEECDVLMIRETDDVQLSNIAKAMTANDMADCHIALYRGSTASNKDTFYMSVSSVGSYRNIELVKSNWQKHHTLGDSLITGLKGTGVKIFSSGVMEMDLTQTSFSIVPSIDIELDDKASDHSDATLNTLADGPVTGVRSYPGR